MNFSWNNNLIEMNVISFCKFVYLELVKIISPIRHARLIGVSIGDNCLVYRSIEWSSEPYLVTIGNNVQLTRGVALHTHGGGMLLDVRCLILIYLEKLKSKIGHI